MEYAKDNVIKLHTLNERKKTEEKDKRWTSKILKLLKKHKLITTILILTLTFSIINTILIYNFFKILITV